MNQQDLRAECIDLPAELAIGGTSYALPTQAWLLGPFWGSFREQLFNESVEDWEVNWECRDFVRFYAAWAQLCNARTPNSPAGTNALAVGEFWYIPDDSKPNDGHALVICFTDQGRIFIDPQTGLLCTLTSAQLRSCYFCRF